MRLLVSVAAAKYVPHRLPYLHQVIQGYLEYSDFIAVDVIIDTVDPILAELLRVSYPFQSMPKGKTLSTNVWTLKDLERLSLVTGVTVHPIEMAVTHAHRHYIHRRYVDYDYVVYTEDDLLMREDAFALFASRNAELWRMGWIMGFLRTERNQQNEVCSSDIMEHWIEEGGTSKVVSLNKHSYVVPASTYNAMWVLDRNQLQTFVTDRSGVFLKGQWRVGLRERMAFGYQHTYSPRKGWVGRTLVPLDDQDLGVDTRALVAHLPNNICNTSTSVVVYGGLCARVTNLGAKRGANRTPLGLHSQRVC